MQESRERSILKGIGLLVLGVLLAGIGGCASLGSAVKTWPGDDFPEDQAAVLHAPEDIEVLSVNGRKMTSYLLDNIAVDYLLKPGPQVVTFKYRSVWATGKASGDNGSPRAQAVESDRLQVRFEARAGEEYDFAFSRPGSRSDAMVLARSFSARVIDSSDVVVARSTDYKPEQAVASESAPTSGSQTQPAGQSSAQSAPALPITRAPAGESLPTLEALQLLWDRASREDKKAFLRWAFQ